MEWLNEWLKGLGDGAASVLQGFAGWLLSLLRAFAEWFLSFLQSSWPAAVDLFGVVVQNPEQIAIWLGSSVLIVLFGVICGTMILRHYDSKSSKSDDTTDFDDEDYDAPDDEYDNSPADSDRLFERRQ